MKAADFDPGVPPGRSWSIAGTNSILDREMTIHSAGILPFRYRDNDLQVMLVHPGGPFWAKKDKGAWSSPQRII